MAVSLAELLLPQVILEVVSRIREQQGRLGRWLGFQPNRYDPKEVALDGPNVVKGDVRNVAFRIFDHTRVVATAKAPNTGPAVIAPNPTGEVRIDCSRYHMKVPLSTEVLGNLSPIMGPNSQIDTGGQNYISQQIEYIHTRFNNVVELMSSGMMQDSLYFLQSGDNIYPQLAPLTAGQFGQQVPFQIPAGNKAQLNMLGTGNLIDLTWANPAAQIMKQIQKIKAAFAQLSGYPMTDVWINSLTWYNLISNTELRNLAGSANTPFAEYKDEPEKGMDGEPTGDRYAVLRAEPTVKFHITDEVLGTGADIDPVYATLPASALATLVKVVPDNQAWFCTEPNRRWTSLYHGGEYVVENPGMPMVLRRGYYYWKEWTTQPGGLDLIGLLNCIPMLKIPKVIAPASVIF
jgi:hypothetical protein